MKEEVAIEATAAIETTEEMTDADLEARGEIAVHARPETIVERVVVTDVMRDPLTEGAETVIAATTTDAIHRNADAAQVTAHVGTTRVTSSLALKVETPKTTATRKAARLQLNVKTDRLRD